MLKCPRCGARVKGPDLLTGICSACQQRLTDSVSPIPEIPDGDKTFVSSEETGDSFASGSMDSAGGGDRSDSAGILSRDIQDSFQLGMTPAVAADGADDRDTATVDAGISMPAQPAGDRTFISDVWVDAGGSGTLDHSASGKPPAAQGSSDSVAQAPTDGGDDAARTYVSDQFDSVDEAASATLGAIPDAPGDGGADRTFVLDDEGPQAADRTFVADESSSGRDEADKTFVSDAVPEALVRTLQSNFGDADEEGTPERTLKGKEQVRTKGPRNTLVIKTRQLRELKVSLITGTDVDPEYELVKILGEGGMGIVYDARQTSIDRNVALKMIKGAAARNEKQQAKFLAEAVVTGDLDHPNIVPIYDVGRSEAGALFYSMKKVQGTPWDDVIREKSLTENLEILMRVADAVAFAHARGVVHRDLKPENTMLGEFGEVLVMDWGLAQPSKEFRKSASITETSSMGGTPAYMAPEMATGPLEIITHLSDVYLLGAMLFEILTGKPPHSGKTAMKCLMAAARNEIIATDKTGELMDIARKAMATRPEDRYQSVQAMQAAIREYQSHSESILLSSRAEDDLAEALKSDEYPKYSKALFGFEEAYELWPGNARAAQGVRLAQLAYADSARRKGDFDLGLSLLDENVPDHRELRTKLLAEKTERESRKQRIATLKRMATGLAVAFSATLTIAFFWISYEADKARRAERTALQEKAAADDARGKEVVAKQDALAARDLAEMKRVEAVTAQQAEAQARMEAVSARDLAEQKRIEAEIAKRKEEYEAYIAQIGLAAAKIEENAFESARTLLDECQADLRNWEWGRLKHLCSQSVRSIDARTPLDALALSPDGRLGATGGWDGVARLWELESGELMHEFKHGGLYVHAVAFSPDGHWLATGSDDPAGYVQLWDLTTGQRAAILQGHTDEVLSVAFSHSGKQLVSTSYDKSARLWNVADRSEVRALQGHTWWVWQAVFSPDDRHIVTVGQDGICLVWDAETGTSTPPFTGHQGPVYCATYAPDGKSIITGGYDRKLLQWSPEQLRPYNFRNLEREQSVKPQPEFRLLGEHGTSIRCLATSDDGDLLLSGSQDNTLRLWNLSSGQLLQTFRGHDSWVRGVAFGHDGRTLVSASQDATLRTWSIAGYEELRSIQGRQLEGHADAILAANFSPDQKLVVTASRDRTARTWDARTGTAQQVFSEGHAFLASSAQFFDEGRKLVTAAVDNTVRIWDVATGTELNRLEHTGRAAAVDVSPDQRWILTGGDQLQAQLWDAHTLKLLQTWDGHVAEVTAVAFSPDSRLAVTADAKGHGRIWEAATGQLLFSLKGHSRRVSRAVFTSDGKFVYTASSDNTVAQWDVSNGEEVRSAVLKHPDAVLDLSLSPDQRTLVTSCADRKVRVWDLASREVRLTLGPFPELVQSVEVSGDSRQLLTAHAEERAARLWDLSSGQELRLPNAHGQLGPAVDLKRSGGLIWSAIFAPGNEILTVGGNDARLWDVKTGQERITFSPHATVASASFSPDGRWIVTGSWDNSAKIWNAASGKAILKLGGAHQGFVNSAQFSPDGRYVLTASDDGTASLWQLTLPEGDEDVIPAGEVVRTFTGHTDRVRFAAFSPDGTQVVTTSDDKTARIWNAADGQLVRELTGHKWAVLSADFSPDGQRIITGSEDNFARIWDVATGETDQQLGGHTAPVTSVAFAPDGQRVVTGSSDQSAKLWDSRTGKEILTLSRHTDDVTSVRFSPDGSQILTGSRDGTAIIWLTVNWHAATEMGATAQYP